MASVSSRKKTKLKVQCEESKIQCQECKKLYATERTLWTHMVNIHLKSRSVPSIYVGRITADTFFEEVKYEEPVFFLMDKNRMETNKKYKPINDDTMSVEVANAYQEGPLKECGCFPSCRRRDCCAKGQPCHKTCACHCLAGDDEVVALFSGIPNCDLTPELQKTYAHQYWQREGFDIAYADYFREHVGHLRHMMHRLPRRQYPHPGGLDEEENDLFKNFAVLAIKRYNKMHLDTYYKCVQLLAVNAIFGGEYLYFITFVAVCHQIAVPQVFQAKLSFSYEGAHAEDHVTRVLLCRLKPDN